MSKVSGPERDKKGSQAWQTAAPSVIVLRPTNATFAKDKLPCRSPIGTPATSGCRRRGRASTMFRLRYFVFLCGSLLANCRLPFMIRKSWRRSARRPNLKSGWKASSTYGTLKRSATLVSALCLTIGRYVRTWGRYVTISGRSLKCQTYSKYSHWYYVDLQCLPDDISDGIIYDWLAKHYTPPVYTTPTHVIIGLLLRKRRVFFSQKSPSTLVCWTSALCYAKSSLLVKILRLCIHG